MMKFYRRHIISIILLLIMLGHFLSLTNSRSKVVDPNSNEFPVIKSILVGGSSEEYQSKVLIDSNGNYLLLSTSSSSDFLHIPFASSYSNPFVSKFTPVHSGSMTPAFDRGLPARRCTASR